MKYLVVIAPNYVELGLKLNNLASAGWRLVSAFALPLPPEVGIIPGTAVTGDFYAVLEHAETP